MTHNSTTWKMSLGLAGVGLLVLLLAYASYGLYVTERGARTAARSARFEGAVSDLLFLLDRPDFSSRTPRLVRELERLGAGDETRAEDLDSLKAIAGRTPVPRQEIRTVLLRMIRRESRSVELRSRAAASGNRPLSTTVSFGALLGLSLIGLSAFLIGRDLTGRRKEDAALKEMAMVDDLTGLYNRRGFIAHARDLLALAERMESPAVVFLADVDGLKAINDRFGHASGDLALAGAARVLQLTFRSSDVIARLGGDEFAVLALVESRNDGKSILQRVQKNVDFWNSRSRQPFEVSLSTGLVSTEPSEASLESLLAEADRVMYEKKEARRTGPA